MQQRVKEPNLLWKQPQCRQCSRHHLAIRTGLVRASSRSTCHYHMEHTRVGMPPQTILKCLLPSWMNTTMCFNNILIETKIMVHQMEEDWQCLDNIWIAKMQGQLEET